VMTVHHTRLYHVNSFIKQQHFHLWTRDCQSLKYFMTIEKENIYPVTSLKIITVSEKLKAIFIKSLTYDIAFLLYLVLSSGVYILSSRNTQCINFIHLTQFVHLLKISLSFLWISTETKLKNSILNHDLLDEFFLLKLRSA
jgi:hypothetical protein